MKCFELHDKLDFPCDKKECKMWIDYEKDLNCTLITVERHGPLTLREIADRIKISFVGVKQVQDRAIRKIARRVQNENLPLK